MFTILLAASVIPPLYLLWKVFQQDKIEKEPPKLLLVIFILGMISTLPAGLLESVGQNVILAIVPESFASTSMGQTIVNLLFYVIIVGGAEELCKYVAMKIPTWRSPEFNYVFDGVVYGVTAAAGFATLENILYVLDGGLVTAGVRAWTAIPLHIIVGIFMGHYYGIAKVAESVGDRKACGRFKRTAVIVPMLVHGFYDFIATGENDLFIILFFIYIVIVDVFAIKALNRYAQTDVPIG